MNARDVIKLALNSTQQVLNMYLSDLTDEDLANRPVPSANTPAWQLGHLIQAEGHLLKDELPGAVYPEVPANFKADYGADGSKKVPAGGYLKKEQYIDLFNKARAATVANVDRMTDADLDRPTKGIMKDFAPTLGALLILTANHTLMHAGQFTVTRRALGKPVLF